MKHSLTNLEFKTFFKKILFWLLFLIIAFIVGLKSGYIYISWPEIWQSFFKISSFRVHTVLFEVRIPRLLAALLVGGGLALTGTIYQSVLKNPLAEPYLLGVASGAAVGAALGYLFKPALVPIIAFIFACGALFLVLALAKSIGKFSLLSIILSGVMLNTFFSSVLLLMVRLCPNQSRSILSWLLGSLEHFTYNQLLPLFLLSAFFIILFITYAKGLDLFLLSDTEVESLGVSLPRLRFYFLFGASMLAAVMVAYAGIIGFVGLIVPHLCRLQIGAKHIYRLPLVFIAGGTFLLIADVVSYLPIWGIPLPVGLITSLLGVPYFLYMLVKNNAAS